MSQQPVRFAGEYGDLAGSLELPVSELRGVALFAHCFTCGKDSIAASRIARMLAASGVAVLRFDFTGLGGSGGDFASSGFTANVLDIVAAANYLRAEVAAPSLLIGHSLGGTAVLAAAEHIDECKAVVTIGAPASPDHLIDQFGTNIAAIERDGEAEVELAGRSFKINKTFIDDLRSVSMPDRVRRLRRALMVMHSPVDTVVNIAEAGAIFSAALHPKSFVSLDQANHLLTSSADAEYVAATIAGWAQRYLPPKVAVRRPAVPAGSVQANEKNKRFLREIFTDDHVLPADEPERVGGDNLGPDPYELLLASLGACTSMTLRMYANRKKWPLDNVTAVLEHERVHAEDCSGCDEPNRKLAVIRVKLRLEGDLSAEQRSRLLEIADRCPVHKTLLGEIRIETTAIQSDGGVS